MDYEYVTGRHGITNFGHFVFDINFPSAQYFRCGSRLFFNPRPGQIPLLYRLGISRLVAFSIGRHIISSSFALLFNYFANERPMEINAYIYRTKLRVALLSVYEFHFRSTN